MVVKWPGMWLSGQSHALNVEGPASTLAMLRNAVVGEAAISDLQNADEILLAKIRYGLFILVLGLKIFIWINLVQVSLDWIS